MNEPAPVAKPSRFTGVLFSVIVISTGFVFFLSRQSLMRPPDKATPVGETAPAISAVGWFNIENPENAQREGKVIVLQAWMTSCPYCLKEMPKIARLHEKYGDEVQFIGLTPESPDMKEQIAGYVEEYEMVWPVGYGAVESLTKFEAMYFPSVWVIGVDGKVVWNHKSKGELEDGIKLALKAAQ